MRTTLRNLLRTPIFTVGVVAILALGIAANTSIFTIVRGVLLRDLSFREPDKLVWVWSTRTDRDKAFFSIPNFVDTQRATASLVELSAFANWSANLTGSGEAERLQGVRISPDAFELLGVQPAAGRLIVADDGVPGADRVVVLSYALWQRRFGADAAVLDSEVILNGDPFRVVGVLPAQFVLPNADTDLISPLVLETDPRRTERGSNFLRVFGRLRHGTSVGTLGAEMKAITERLRIAYPVDNAKHTAPRVQLLAEELVGSYRASLWVLFAAVGLVLAIACANLANLVVGRSAGRSVEMAVRVALGASRAQLARQLFNECLLLGLVGGAGGLIFAWWLVRGVRWIAPSGLPRVAEIGLDWQALLFTAVLSILTASALAVIPAMTAGRGNINETLKRAVRSRSDSGNGKSRSVLAVVEVAASLVLMIAAGLFIRSFIRLQSVDSGVKADHVLVTRFSLPSIKYSTSVSTSQFVTNLLAEIHAPAAVASALPLSGINSRTDFVVRGYPPTRVEDTPGAQNRWVSDDYFEVMGIHLIRGRRFQSFDRNRGEPVAIVDEALVQRFVGTNDPLQQSLIIDFGDGRPARTVKIVGMVASVKHFALDDMPTPTIYFPVAQVWPSALTAVNSGMTVVVKTAAEPLAMADTLRRIIASLDSEIAMSVPTTMDQVISTAVAPRRFIMRLMETFAGAGLLLSILGLYTVLSYSISQRRHEIAVRIALGAVRLNVVGLVMLQGMKLALVGCALGVIAAVAASRAISGMLYQTEAVDPMSYIFATLLLLVVAAGAIYVTASKAARTDPVQTFRQT
jgi:predicted permease